MTEDEEEMVKVAAVGWCGRGPVKEHSNLLLLVSDVKKVERL